MVGGFSFGSRDIRLILWFEQEVDNIIGH